jgi:hypothetical protein
MNNTNTRDSKTLISNAVRHAEITNMSLGKYIFLIIPGFPTMQFIPMVVARLRKFQMMIPSNRKSW